MNQRKNNLWMFIPRPNSNAKIRLICLPYAGGSASAYRSWLKYLPEDIELCAVQLPGRENRIGEPLLKDGLTIVKELLPTILEYQDKPYILFGHSMGAKICFELARGLRKANAKPPKALFVSGGRAPQVKRREKDLHLLPEEEFVEWIRSFNGTPDEVFDDPELRALYLPILQADAAIEETYTYQEQPPLDIPIIAFAGIDDEAVKEEEVKPWVDYTNKEFHYHACKGAHFFIWENEKEALRTIVEEINHLL
jgi:medium-chain acyl-[acyl-carrier-protein] hydrolase